MVMPGGGARLMSNDEAVNAFGQQAAGAGQAQISIEDLKSAETVKCGKCQSSVWGQGMVIKKTSALSMTGEQMVNLPVIFCQACGTPLPDSCPIDI